MGGESICTGRLGKEEADEQKDGGGDKPAGSVALAWPLRAVVLLRCFLLIGTRRLDGAKLSSRARNARSKLADGGACEFRPVALVLICAVMLLCEELFWALSSGPLPKCFSPASVLARPLRKTLFYAIPSR